MSINVWCRTIQNWVCMCDHFWCGVSTISYKGSENTVEDPPGGEEVGVSFGDKTKDSTIIIDKTLKDIYLNISYMRNVDWRN